MNSITSLVWQHLPTDRKSAPNNGVYICCPMCLSRGESRNDTRFRGGFTPHGDGFIYHCHNCGYATQYEEGGRVGKNLMRFLTTIGIPSKEIPIQLRLLPPGEKLNKAIKIEVPDVAIDFDEMKLPDGCRPFDYWVDDVEDTPALFLQAFEYLAERGEAVFNGWKYYWTDKWDYKNNRRIIIPFYHNGKIVGFTGRRFDDNVGISKYWMKKPEDYMFNQDKLQNDDELIILVEGPLDAIAIKGVAVLGNHLSDKQLNLLRASKKRIILVPDRNKAGAILLDQAMDEGWEIAIPGWDRGIDDVANATKKYGRLYTLESILEAATTNKIKIKIHFGLSRI
jgi:hypothetical protein